MILTVEDEDDIRAWIVAILADDYTVLEAKNGAEADHILSGPNRRNIKLILLDIHLPDMSAFETRKQWERVGFMDIPPIVILTAYSDPQMIIKSMTGLGAQAFLSKPVTKDLLMETVRTVISEPKLGVMRKREELFKDIFVTMMCTMRQERFSTLLPDYRKLQGPPIDPLEWASLWNPTPGIAHKKSPLEDLLALLEEDTGQKPTPPWTPKILIVEDEVDIRESTDLMLRTDGFKTCIASTGQEALSFLAKNRNIDMVLLDVGLPDMSGIDLLKAIKHTHQVMDYTKPQNVMGLDVIALTCYNDLDTIVSMTREGAYQYLTKPFERAHLIDIIQQTARRRYHQLACWELLRHLQEQRIPYRLRLDALVFAVTQNEGDLFPAAVLYTRFPELNLDPSPAILSFSKSEFLADPRGFMEGLKFSRPKV